jgi:nucleotide-binding universal stress UspA family protein
MVRMPGIRSLVMALVDPKHNGRGNFSYVSNGSNRELTMDNQESSNAVTLNRLLVATDFSAASESAFEYAKSITERYRAQMYVAHVIDLDVFDLISSESSTELMKEADEQARRKIAGMLTTSGIPSDQCHIVITHGVVPEALTGIIRQHEIDLAVVGTHGRRAVKKLLLGSVAEEVFRLSPCPVLTVGPKTAPVAANVKLQHVLYPVEFAPDPSNAANYAISLAERYGAKLTIMNVAEDMRASANRQEDFPIPGERWIDDHISRSSGLRSRLYFESGSGQAAEAILSYASNAGVDLIVLGIDWRDPTIAAHLPKSDTAYRLVSGAPCPVLTVGNGQKG